jgi:hypothetical protein
MNFLICGVLGVVLATGSVTVAVHESTDPQTPPSAQLYNYGTR